MMHSVSPEGMLWFSSLAVMSKGIALTWTGGLPRKKDLNVLWKMDFVWWIFWFDKQSGKSISL